MKLEITSSPTYSQVVEGQSFDFNVVGALTAVSYQFRNIQALGVIASNSAGELGIEVDSTISDYLTSLSSYLATIGGKLQVYVSDNKMSGYNYTGSYNVEAVESGVLGGTELVIRRTASPTQSAYYGNKSWSNGECYVYYRYNVTLDFNVYDVTEINNIVRRVLIAESSAQLPSNGEVWFNISEVARGYISDNKSVAISVEATVRDYMGDTATAITAPCICSEAYISAQNYGDYTLFNPINGGRFLPSMARYAFYSASVSKVYPYFLNFVVNDIVTTTNSQFKINLTLFDADGTQITQLTQLEQYNQGVNSIDISATMSELIPEIVQLGDAAFVEVSITLVEGTFGEFNNEFDPQQFSVGASTDIRTSGIVRVELKEYTLNDRRDFYFVFPNNIGGLSTFLCNDYERSVEPEIVALRNASTISNSVSRETERVELNFPQLDVESMAFLTGYDVRTAVKNHGIFESKQVQRITAAGGRTTWIIEEDEYSTANGGLYEDLSVTLYRPFGANY